MKPWVGVGEAYAASYASLCEGTVETPAIGLVRDPRFNDGNPPVH